VRLQPAIGAATFVRGARVAISTRVRYGELIELGSTRLVPGPRWETHLPLEWPRHEPLRTSDDPVEQRLLAELLKHAAWLREGFTTLNPSVWGYS
jgi:hypothetical protein